jgi:hypothetical protein
LWGLLKRCTSVEPVRLCLQLGREQSPPWAKKLDPSSCQERRPALGVPLRRRASGAEATNRMYLDTVRLLTRVAPLVLVDDTFALKGGTAINLFVRDMPRLSIELT